VEIGTIGGGEAFAQAFAKQGIEGRQQGLSLATAAVPEQPPKKKLSIKLGPGATAGLQGGGSGL